jgi:hypothetical protein
MIEIISDFGWGLLVAVGLVSIGLIVWGMDELMYRIGVDLE